MSYKIVIADDEVHIRLLLEQTLEDLTEMYDLKILTASNGDEALSLILEEKPHLVFLDIMMPQKDGFTVCQAVTENPDCKETQILLLTARGQTSDKEQGEAMGAFHYLTKPFDPDYILGITKELLGLDG